MHLRPLAGCALLLLAPAGGAASDPEVVERIRVEAFERSQVMETLRRLSDVHGPRLSGSPGYRAAAQSSVERLRSWGIRADLERWGRFGRGWELRRFSAHLVAPVHDTLHGVPLAWTSGTAGVVSAPVVAAPLGRRELDPSALREQVAEYAARHRGRLRGRVVLLDPPRHLDQPSEPLSERLDAEDRSELLQTPEPTAPSEARYPVDRLPEDRRERYRLLASLPQELEIDHYMRLTRARDTLNAFLRDEGVVAALRTDPRGEGGTVFVEDGGSWEVGAPEPPPIVNLAPEDYGRLYRLVESGEPVRVEIDVDAAFLGPVDGSNVIAELPGGAKREEVVMLGGHLDSWHAGTGATDNAAGCAVAIEALRILAALELPLARSVRLGLWDGEEQGYYGSRAYVREHFADPVSMALKPDHARFSVYFNLDDGTGRIRGVYLQGNDRAQPVFEAWLPLLAGLGVDTLTLQGASGSDHISFDAVGLPAFHLLQDPLDYESRTHHSELDVYDHAEEEDLMQASAVLASLVYLAANRDERLPRKPLPGPIRGEPGATLIGTP